MNLVVAKKFVERHVSASSRPDGWDSRQQNERTKFLYYSTPCLCVSLSLCVFLTIFFFSSIEYNFWIKNARRQRTISIRLTCRKKSILFWRPVSHLTAHHTCRFWPKKSLKLPSVYVTVRLTKTNGRNGTWSAWKIDCGLEELTESRLSSTLCVWSTRRRVLASVSISIF